MFLLEDDSGVSGLLYINGGRGGEELFYIPVMGLKVCITKPGEINVSKPWKNKSKCKKEMEASRYSYPKSG